MGTRELQRMRALEGHRVGLALRGGSRIDDCQLVAAGRSRVRTAWIFDSGDDAFVPLDDILDLWEVA
jgi:hypothetical protein